MSRLAAVSISRSELVIRTVKYADVLPVRKAFDLPGFDKGVEQMLQRKHESLSDYAKDDFKVGESILKIIPVHRNLVQHGKDVVDVIKKTRPGCVAIPTGFSKLNDHISKTAFLRDHCCASYPTESSLLKAEVDLLEKCITQPTLSGVLDRKLLLQIRQPAAVGLRSRKLFNFNKCHLLHYPFFRAVWAAQLSSMEVMWAGIDPTLFEERARSKSLQVEWDHAVSQENQLATEGMGYSNEWFKANVQKRKSYLTPQEFLSDLNMRAVIYNIRRRKATVNKKCLLVVPASEYHLAVGWASSCDSLTATAYNQAIDISLDAVPSFEKSSKSPEFTQIERAIHSDTLKSDSYSDDLALSQDPRLASTPGRHNPFITSLLKPSTAIKSLDIKKLDGDVFDQINDTTAS